LAKADILTFPGGGWVGGGWVGGWRLEELELKQALRFCDKDQTEAEFSEELDTWFAFFDRNDTTKTIIKEKDPLLYSKSNELKVKKDSVKKIESKKDIENKSEEDECVCDYDVNCQFCRSIWDAEVVFHLIRPR
jgi:hypothetical protein